MGYDQDLNPRSHMSLLTIVITLIVVGVLLLVINKYIPMDAKINKILNAVVVIAVIIWLLYAFGIIGHTGDIRLPEVK
jgi:1-acyl-sn-glycerol-3-phosphate acyltransferase